MTVHDLGTHYLVYHIFNHLYKCQFYWDLMVHCRNCEWIIRPQLNLGTDPLTIPRVSHQVKW